CMVMEYTGKDLLPHRSTLALLISSPSFTFSPTNRGLLVEADRCAEESRNTVWMRFFFDGAIAWLKFRFANTHGYCVVHVKMKKNVLLGSGLSLK
ncbi:MAG: hypothetical protein U0I00_06595, partial [Eggerthellaceae bacterium]|nr:hypothetical protein [Eggerthellaceae bacterium]